MHTFSRLARWAPAALALAACGEDTTQASTGGDGGGGAGDATTSITATGASGSLSASSGGNGGGDATGGGSGGGAAIEGLGAILWEECPISSDELFGTGAECATIEAPARWDDPGVGRIELFLKRIRGAEQPARSQVWYLNGGPGYAGSDYEPLAEAVVNAEPTLDVYLLDHRGTGRSSRLGCESAESAESDGGRGITVAEMPGCIDGLVDTWGARLDGFSTTNAAHDVIELARATREGDQRIVIDGGSYGSHWANRVMQIDPDLAAGVILDATAVNSSLARIDRYFDELGHRWAALCATDELCQEKLGPNPETTWARALDKLDSGECEIDPRLDRATLHALMAFFFYVWDYRPLVAPIVHRLDRCEPRDVRALAAFADNLLAEPPPPLPTETYFSILLSNHVALSEMWEDATLEDTIAFRDQALVTHGSVEEAVPLQDIWPRYPQDELVGGFADTSARTLILHGEYDFLSYEEVVVPTVDHFAGETSQYVEMPRAPHGTFQSPIEPGTPSCGSRIMMQFFRDPTAPVDPACTEDVIPISFDVPNNLAGVFGTNDEWDGDPDVQSLTPVLAPRGILDGARGQPLRQRLTWLQSR